MEASAVLDIALPIVFIIVGLALVWLLVELVKTVKTARKTVEELKAQIDPTLANVEKITNDIKPAVERVDPLVERVNLTVDAANLEIMRIDGILENVDGITGTLANTTSTIDNVASMPMNAVNNVSGRLRSAIRGRRSSAESASLAEAAAQARLDQEDEPAHAPASVLEDERVAEHVEHIEEAENKYYTYDPSQVEE